MSTVLPNVPITTPAPEPGPDWPIAREQWGVAWPLHWLGLGLAFALLALNSISALVLADRTKAFARKPFFVGVNALLVALGTTRACYLWIDPYESGENISECPPWLVRPMFGIAFPCLTSAFCLVHLALIESSKIQVGALRVQSTPYVATVIVIHFAVVTVADVTVALETRRTEMLIVCQAFFVAWGLLNSLASLYSGRAIICKLKETQKQLQSFEPSRSQASSRQSRNNTLKVTKITVLGSLLGCVCCALQLYSVVGVYGSYSKVVDPAPWPWFVFQTSFRVVELALAGTIVYAVLQPSRSGARNLLWFRPCKARQVRNVAWVGTSKGVSTRQSRPTDGASPACGSGSELPRERGNGRDRLAIPDI